MLVLKKKIMEVLECYEDANLGSEYAREAIALEVLKILKKGK